MIFQKKTKKKYDNKINSIPTYWVCDYHVYNKSFEIYILPVGRFESDISNSVEILGGERVLREIVTSFWVIFSDAAAAAELWERSMSIPLSNCNSTIAL